MSNEGNESLVELLAEMLDNAYSASGIEPELVRRAYRLAYDNVCNCCVDNECECEGRNLSGGATPVDESDWTINFYGQPVTPPEYFNGDHVASVPPVAGLPPVCACGWTPHSDYTMADHLRDMSQS